MCNYKNTALKLVASFTEPVKLFKSWTRWVIKVSQLLCFFCLHVVGTGQDLIFISFSRCVLVTVKSIFNLLIIQIANKLTNAVSSELEGFRWPK